MIKVSIVDRTPHTRLNGVARYMLGITGLETSSDSNINLRVLRWGRHQKAALWHRNFTPRNYHPKLNHFNRRVLRPLAQRLYRPDIVHYPYHYLPDNWHTGPGKKVVTVHGASAFSKNLLDPDRGESIKRNLQAGLSSLERIITVSEWSKAELIKHMELPESLISVIPNGVDVQHFSPKSKSETSFNLMQQFGLTEPYILNLGPAEPRKNIVITIKAFARLKKIRHHKASENSQHRDLKLVLSGLPGKDTKRSVELCRELGIDKDVVWLGKIKDEYLPYLYSGATLFLFPSLYEGFGIPLLESMACNTPVITSNVTAIPEVVGDAAVLIDPHCEIDIANACHQLMNNKVMYKSMQEKGRLRANHYSWKRCAEAHMTLYQEVASSG